MENSGKKCGGVEILKKKRSLDLKCIYESRVAPVGESERKVSEGNDLGNVKKHRKRKSGKEVALSSFESDAKRSRKEDVNGVKSEGGFSQKPSGRSKELHGISLDLGGNGNTFTFPKRPRDLVGRKKLETDHAAESLELSNSGPDSVDCAGTFNGGVIKCENGAGPSDGLVRSISPSAGNDGTSNSNKSAGKASGSNTKIKQKEDLRSTSKGSNSNAKLKRKVRASILKESRKGKASTQHVEEENSVAVNNCNMPSKKQRSNNSKKKDLVVGGDGGKASKKKSKPSVLRPVSDSLLVDFDEDDEDEEKLEQNAARMLSSRFDPSCTGFSSKRKSSVFQTVNECSIPVSSSRDSFSQQVISASGGDSASADDKSRVLRPRTEDKGKGLPRKRRHFYEILPRDLDPLWVLNQRIKVFWPLDESWYYGIVSGYFPEWRLHRIKYDDRDEELIDLHEEKFKLLLFPSDVPGKVKSKKGQEKSKKVSPRNNDVHKEEAVLPEDDDSCMGKYLDSEPIALWLARSSQRCKSLAKSLKTQRTAPMELPMASSLFSEKTDNKSNNMADSKITGNNPDFESTSSDNLVVCEGVHKSVLGDLNGSRVVYARKKYQKKVEGSGSMSRDIRTYGSASGTVTSLAPTVILPATAGDRFYRYVDSEKQLWSVDHRGLLRLNVVLVESKELRFQICLPVLPFSVFSLGIGDFWLFRNILMLKHGAILSTSPAVLLEMLFVDSYLGLRFLLFEGCMKQAMAFVFLILIAFSQPDEQINGAMQSPVTSIRLRLSSAQYLRKHHIFEFHSFSRLKSSKWLCLDSKLLQHCLLIKKLQVSDCTYDNIKELEGGSLKQCKPNVVLELPSFTGILPMGFSKEACNTRSSQSALNLAAKPGKVPRFGLSFSAVPSFFLTLHLQLLMENNSPWDSHNEHDALCSSEADHGGITHADCIQFEPSFVAVQDITAEPKIGNKEIRGSNIVEKVDSSENLHRENPNDAESAGFFKDFRELTPEAFSPSDLCDTNLLEEGVVTFPSAPTSTTSPTSNSRSSSRLGGMTVDIPSGDRVDMPLDGKACISRQPSDASWNVNEGHIQGHSPTASRFSWEGSRGSLISSPLGDLSLILPDWSPKFMRGGFSNGPKKRRTQVQYTLPGAGYNFMPKQNMQDQSALPCKRIRRASLKRISDDSRGNQKNFELLSCGANVLVTHGDKGWRERGALIVLEVADENEWRLAIKLAGVTKYSYKVKHVLQPGTNNRYSHSMLWKGGKDWVLEFPNRSQWTLFKEMHEECYNRNIRAASVKNIPIPGVCLIEENDDYGTGVPFVRNSIKYFRQVQTDVEMAMDPSHILYDMDSDDERWLMANKKFTDKITDRFLEKTMDIFEKVAYVQHRDNFTDDEIKELVIGIGSGEAAKEIYQHWREKRGRKGMPLIRHLQPPLWERYQQQLKEWEHTLARGNLTVSVGSQEKISTPEKPPMFAFCLKPRGLDVPNRGSKQRSHKKFPVSGHLRAVSRDHDSPRVSGRRSKDQSVGVEEVLYTNNVYESSDVSPSLQGSRRVFSPRNVHFSLSTDFSKSSRSSKEYKNKPRELGSCSFSNNQQMISYNQRTIGNRNEVQQWNMGLLDLPNRRHYHIEGPWKQEVEGLNVFDRHQFWLRNALSAAKQGAKIAKLKKKKAQELFHKADLAVHRAVIALMNAEALKAATENLNGGN